MAFGKKKKAKDNITEEIEEMLQIPSPIGDFEEEEEEEEMSMAISMPSTVLDPQQEQKLNRINGLKGLGADFNGRKLSSLKEEELKDFILSNILKSIYTGDYYRISMYGREKSTLVDVCLKDEHIGDDLDGIFTTAGKILLNNLQEGRQVTALDDAEVSTYPVREIKDVVEEFIINQNGLVEINYRIDKYSLEQLTEEVLKLVDLGVGVSKIACRMEKKEAATIASKEPQAPSEEGQVTPAPNGLFTVVENICISLGRKLDGIQVVLKLLSYNSTYVEMEREFKSK